MACYDIIENDPDSLCFGSFFGADDAIVLNKRFDEIIAREYDLHSINREISERVFFDLSLNNCTEENNRRLDEVFVNLNIDESCWDNCPKLNEDRDYDYRKKCVVAKRKVKRDYF